MSDYDTPIEQTEEASWEYAYDDLGNPTLRWKNGAAPRKQVNDSSDQTHNLLRALDCPTLSLEDDGEESFDPYDTGVRLQKRSWD